MADLFYEEVYVVFGLVSLGLLSYGVSKIAEGASTLKNCYKELEQIRKNTKRSESKLESDLD